MSNCGKMTNNKMKILFVVPSFRNGGTNTSLRNMVSMLKKENLDLYVFAITDTGPNKSFLSQHCTMLNPAGNPSSSSHQKGFVSKFASLVKRTKKLLERIGIDISPIVFNRVAKSLQKHSFDLVVAFQEETATHFCSYFDKTKKIAWIRCDFSRYLSSPQIISRNKKIYSVYDKIVCVSEFTCKQFLSVIPELKSVTISLHNLINDGLIIDRAREKVVLPWAGSVFCIVSVGRFDKVKRFEFIPKIAAEIKRNGIPFKWIVLGGGNDTVKAEVANNISRYDVQDNVILYGEVNNPYPYIANSHLLVCLSSTEACPNVINEAKILHVPVVATDFGSVYEFLDNKNVGLIAPIEQIGKTISDLIANKDEYKRFKDNISSFKYDNDAIINVLEKEVLK